jgi:hypothetical protein
MFEKEDKSKPDEPKKPVFITGNDINNIRMSTDDAKDLQTYPYTFFDQSTDRLWFL